MDVGTSGGVHGLERGYCLMIGSTGSISNALNQSSPAWPPGVGDGGAPGRLGDPGAENSVIFIADTYGAGHFVEMIHNGIEYGLMAAYAGRS